MSHAPVSPVARRISLLTTLVVLALSVFAQSALASTAEVFGTELDYTAAAGETNNVVVAFDGNTGQVTLTDTGVGTLPVPDNTGAAGANCTRPTNTTIVCTGLTSGSFSLDDMNDSLDASQIPSPGYITADGDAGNDTLTGTAGSDTLNGDAGTDTINGGGGDDQLTDTSDAGDTLNGGGGDDSFYLGSAVDGTDSYDGGVGVDSLDYSSRTTSLTANLAAGTESTTGGGESDGIVGFENLYGPFSLGANNITGDDQANDLEGGPGHDVINGAGGNDTLVGMGSNGNDIDGGAGNDEIYGDTGADNLTGGDGNDLLRGEDGQDQLAGGIGDDDLDPGSHFDGNDFVSDGSDTLDGGDGSDTVEYGDRNHALTVDLSGGSTATTANGEAGENDSLKNLENINAGFGGSSTLTGNDAANKIIAFGGAGDTVNGLGGNDDIRVEDDNVDSVVCGDGSDSLIADRTSDGDLVNDTFGADCETVNGVGPGTGGGTDTGGGGGGTTTTPVTTPVVTPPVTPPPPVVFTLGAFVASKQQSPKANKVAGSATIATDGSNLEVDVFNGKPSKKTLAGKVVKKGLKKGVTPFVVTLNKKASKAAAKKKSGVKMTVKVTIKPPSGSSFVKTFKVTVKKGKAPACFRTAQVRAHAAC